MNTKLLKQKILDLAIRGILTQQLKSDGTAADLLKEISSTCHPERSAKGAKSKDPGAIIPLDKSEAPFEIPANWEWVRLGNVAYIASGSTPSKDCFVESGVPYLKMYNLRNQQIDFEYKPQYIKREVHEGKLARSKAKPGDVIMNIVGPPLGKVALVPESLPECNFNQAAVLIRAHFCTNLMNQYIRYFLLQMDEINAINTKGTAGQENISLTQTQNMRFPLPPLAEQQRIVEKIQEAFAEIEAIEKNKELLKTHIKQTRQKILDLAIHGKLVPQNKSDEPASVLLERITRDNPHYEKIGLDERRETKDERGFKDKCHSREGGNLLAPISKDEIPFDIPENWVWCRLGDILAPMQSTTPKGAFFKYIDIDAIDNSTCRIKAPKMIESKNAPSRASRFTKKGDILFSLVRPYLRNIAKVTENDCIASTGFFVCSPIIVNSDFCFFLLTSNYVVDGLNQFMKGDNSPSISSQNLIDFTIPLPPLNEQSQIVAKIEELFFALDQMERNLV